MTDLNPARTQRSVLVCQHRTCKKQGAIAVLAALHRFDPVGWTILPSSCLGQCGNGPIVRVRPEEVWYCRVQPEEVAAIVDRHLLKGQPIPAMYCSIMG